MKIGSTSNEIHNWSLPLIQKHRIRTAVEFKTGKEASRLGKDNRPNDTKRISATQSASVKLTQQNNNNKRDVIKTVTF